MTKTVEQEKKDFSTFWILWTIYFFALAFNFYYIVIKLNTSSFLSLYWSVDGKEFLSKFSSSVYILYFYIILFPQLLWLPIRRTLDKEHNRKTDFSNLKKSFKVFGFPLLISFVLKFLIS